MSLAVEQKRASATGRSMTDVTTETAFGQVFLVVILGAAILRWFFYTGFYGSDEVTYLGAAVRALHGDLSPSSYIGSIRYGFQVPIAAFMAVLGQNTLGANAWTFLCSVAEVALVMLAGKALLGPRAGILAGVVLATLPLHVHYAGRIMADPPLSFFMSLSVVMFWLGQSRDRIGAFFAAGLAAGMVFWIKESTVLYLALFLFYPLLFRVWNWKWAWMLAGFGMMLAGNLAFFWMISGNPFYVFKIAGASVSNYLNDSPGFAMVIDAPSYYFEYLFAKPYHTWLAGFAAAAGLLLWLRDRFSRREDGEGPSFVVWWAVGMVAVFSLLPVSFQPLKLITKQVNYMLVFMAPIALLGGYALAHLEGKRLAGALALLIGPALVLSAMEKNVVSVFTANSKAAVKWAIAHPAVQVYGSTGAQRAAMFHRMMNPDSTAIEIQPLANLRGVNVSEHAAHEVFAVVDTEMETWGRQRVAGVQGIPSCWIPNGTLQPVDDLVFTKVFEFAMAGLRLVLPKDAGNAVRQRIDALMKPSPAYLFKVESGRCVADQTAISSPG